MLHALATKKDTPAPTLSDGQAIVLRPLTVRDAPELFSVVSRNRAHLDPHLAWLPTIQSAADSARFIQKCQRQYARGKTVAFGIFYEGRLVGHISLSNIRKRQSATIGYWLARDMQGKGIVTTAARRLLGYAFGDLRLSRVQLKARVSNRRSLAVAQRLGFVRETTVKGGEDHHGVRYDMHLYIITPEQLAPGA